VPGIDGDLAGNEDEIAGANGRGIGAARGGPAWRRDALNHDSVSFRFQETFGFHGGAAAGAGGGDGLAVRAVLTSPAWKMPGTLVRAPPFETM